LFNGFGKGLSRSVNIDPEVQYSTSCPLVFMPSPSMVAKRGMLWDTLELGVETMMSFIEGWRSESVFEGG
jgi:hypothetical protein